MCTRTIGRAFTIIELMIVVLILAILAAILVPGFANASGSAAVTAVATDLRAFERASGLFVLDVNGDLPMSNEEYRLGIAPYLEADATIRKPALGGDYGFHVWGTADAAAIGVWNVEQPELRVEVDAKIDDGNLATGVMHGVTSAGLLFLVHGEESSFTWP